MVKKVWTYNNKSESLMYATLDVVSYRP